MKRIKNIKVLASGIGALVILAAVAIISAQGATGEKKSTYEQKIDKIMTQYVLAIQTTENSSERKMNIIIKSARIARDRAIAKTGLAVEAQLTRAGKDSTRLGRPEGAKVAQEKLAEIKELTKQAQTTDPLRPEPKEVDNPVEAEPGPLPSHIAFGRSTYIAILGSHTLPEASVVCRRLGGRLVCIDSAAELLFLQKQLPVNHGLWVGASDARHQGVWRWSTGGAVSRACWAKGQPAKPRYNVDGRFWHSFYASLRSNGMISRSAPDKCKGFICEWRR
jgi:hypothetical protein